MKVDLVMWTYNGGNTLPLVLSCLNRVIPKEVINQKFIVDDGSKDDTVLIARESGWSILRNEGKGISDGANTALKHVQTPYFCSFEQDVVLADDWWRKVSPLILGVNSVGAASGIRFLPQNNFVYSIEPYQLTRKEVDFYGGYGKTLDNTIWNTLALRSIGGFPKVNWAGIDTLISHLLEQKHYCWLVNYEVRSLHLHCGGLWNELKHYYFYGLSLPQIYSRLKRFNFYRKENLTQLFMRLAKSPVSSMKMTLKMRDPRLLFAYPIIRLCWLLGYIRGLSASNA